MRTDDLQGAIWILATAGQPGRPCMSLAKGANRRAEWLEGRGDRAVEVVWPCRRPGHQGRRRCETLVNCAGQWAPAGRLAGVNVPLYPAEHFTSSPTDRRRAPDAAGDARPDGFIYYKEEVGGLLMGGFEPVAKPLAVDPIPSTFQFQLLGRRLGAVRAADDQRHPPHAVPGDGGDQDAAQRAGELHARWQLHPWARRRAAQLCLRRLQLGRHRQQRRAPGGLMAEWIAGGEGGQWTCGTWTSAASALHRQPPALAERTGETLGLHYAMRWPRQEL